MTKADFVEVFIWAMVWLAIVIGIEKISDKLSSFFKTKNP